MKVIIIPILILFIGCTNKKAQIVEQLKIAKKNLKAANERLELTKLLQETELDMVAHGNTKNGFKITPLDSLSRWDSLAFVEKYKWEPIADSLEMELKKY